MDVRFFWRVCFEENADFRASRGTNFKRSFGGEGGRSESLDVGPTDSFFTRLLTLVKAADTELAGRIFRRLLELDAVEVKFSSAGRWLIDFSGARDKFKPVARARVGSLNEKLRYLMCCKIDGTWYLSQHYGSQ